MGKHEEIGKLIRELKQHGFTQLRGTTHGWLWSFQEFRFHVPKNLSEGGPIDRVADAWQRWATLKSEVYGANPGMKASLQKPVEVPQAVEDMVPVVNIEDILQDPTSYPPPQEEVPIVANKWKCDQCDRTFKKGGHLGRHKAATHKVVAVNGNVRRPRGVTVIKSTDYKALLAAFETASMQVADTFNALLTERDHYKKERDELNTRFASLRGLLK